MADLSQQLLEIFKQQGPRQVQPLNTGLLTPEQNSISDVFTNPGAAQVDGLIGGIAGAINPRSGNPALGAVAGAARSFRDTRTQQYEQRVKAEELRQAQLKNQLSGALGIAKYNAGQTAAKKTGTITLPNGTTGRGIIDREGRMHMFGDNGEAFDVTGQGAAFGADTSQSVTTNVNTGGASFKVPSGFMLNDTNDPEKGVKPIPGGPKDMLSPEASAKAQLIHGAQQNQSLIDGFLFNEDGSVDRTNVVAGSFKFPFSEGRSMNVLLKDSLEAKIRAESGAAVPDTEIVRLSERFMPSVLDSDETIKIKRQLLDQFLNGTMDKLDPTGRFDRNGTIDNTIKLMDQVLTTKGTVKMYGNIPVIIEDE